VDSYFANASFIKPLMEKGIVVISWLRKGCCRLGRHTGILRQGAPAKKEDYQATTTTAEGATLLHCFLHLEIDIAA